MTADLLVNLLAALVAFCAGLAARGLRSWSKRLLTSRQERIRAVQRRPEYSASWIVEYYRSRGRVDDMFPIAEGDRETRIPFLVRPQWVREDLDEEWLFHQSLPHPVCTAPVNRKVLGRRSRYLVGLEDGEEWNDLHAWARRIVETPTDVRIEVGVCEYFQYMSACGGLEDETYAAIRQRRPRTPIRDRVLPSAEKALECALGANSIGMTVAIVFGVEEDGAGRSGHKVLIQRRSEAVSTYGGALGVVPMFSCQTMDLTERTSVSITHNFLREVYEELYNGKQVQRRSPRVDQAWFLNDPVMAPLLTYMREGGVALQLLGFGFDALNGQLIVGGLLDLGRSEFTPTELGAMYGNWEVNHIEVWDLFGEPLTEALTAGRFTPGCAFTLARSRERIRNSERTDVVP